MSQVKWFDAVLRKEVDVKDLDKHDVKYFLARKETIGKIIKEDKYGIIIEHETDVNEGYDKEENTDIIKQVTVIPKKWLRS